MSNIITKLIAVQEVLAQEAIAFQNDSFGKDLENIIVALQKENIRPNTVGQDYASGKALEQLFMDRLGLKIKMVLSKYSGPAILPAFFDHNHVFLADELKDMYKNHINTTDCVSIVSKREATSYVSMAKARVGGAFSELENILYMPMWAMKPGGKFTPGEITAIILHELGHGFTFLEYVGKKTTVNEMLIIVQSDAFVSASRKDKEFVITHLTGKNEYNPELDKKLSSKSATVRMTVALKAASESSTSGMGSTHYDATMCESLADNFCSRFGYGRELITALDKLYRWMPDRSPLVRAFMTLSRIWKYITLPLIIMGPMNVIVLWNIFMFFFVFFRSGENNQDYTYDRVRVRYLRIREQMVQSTKDESLPDEVIKEILSNIEAVDEVIKKAKNFYTVDDMIMNYLFSSHRNALEISKQQRMLEEIASNDLYLSAAKLRTA